jgi:AcrR family transcriptional regulator
MERMNGSSPAPRAAHRPKTQLERSEATQRRIVASALRLIQKEGFERASLQNIASGAKVTLGAVQHHFGTRDALLERIVDEVLAPLADNGSVWPPQGLPAPERAHEFVRRAWQGIYGAPNYLTAWNLFFGCRSTPSLFRRIDAKQSSEDPQFFARFLEHFPEIAQNHDAPEQFAAFVFASLRGIALMQVFNVAPDAIRGQLEVLCGVIASTASGRRT